MPRVGSSKIRIVGVRRQPLADNHLLLVAARQIPDLLLQAGRLDRQRLAHNCRAAVWRVLQCPPSRARRRNCAEGRPAPCWSPRPCRAPGRSACGPPTDSRCRRARRPLGLWMCTCLAVHLDRARLGRSAPKMSPGHLGAPGADQTGEAEDLAALQCEADVANGAAAVQMLRLQHDVVRWGSRVARAPPRRSCGPPSG